MPQPPAPSLGRETWILSQSYGGPVDLTLDSKDGAHSSRDVRVTPPEAPISRPVDPITFLRAESECPAASHPVPPSG